MGLLDFDSPDTRLGLDCWRQRRHAPMVLGSVNVLQRLWGLWISGVSSSRCKGTRNANAVPTGPDGRSSAKADCRTTCKRDCSTKTGSVTHHFQRWKCGAPAINIDASLPPEMRTGVGFNQPSRHACRVLMYSVRLAGYSPKEIGELDKLRNVGLDKVARTVQGQDEAVNPLRSNG